MNWNNGMNEAQWANLNLSAGICLKGIHLIKSILYIRTDLVGGFKGLCLCGSGKKKWSKQTLVVLCRLLEMTDVFKKFAMADACTLGF